MQRDQAYGRRGQDTVWKAGNKYISCPHLGRWYHLSFSYTGGLGRINKSKGAAVALPTPTSGSPSEETRLRTAIRSSASTMSPRVRIKGSIQNDSVFLFVESGDSSLTIDTGHLTSTKSLIPLSSGLAPVQVAPDMIVFQISLQNIKSGRATAGITDFRIPGRLADNSKNGVERFAVMKDDVEVGSIEVNIDGR